MAKKTYIGVNGVARRVKKMYVGVNGVSKKVKKGYIGVNGVAKLFYSGSGELKLITEYKVQNAYSANYGNDYTHLNNNAMFLVKKHNRYDDSYDKNTLRLLRVDTAGTVVMDTIGRYNVISACGWTNKKAYLGRSDLTTTAQDYGWFLYDTSFTRTAIKDSNWAYSPGNIGCRSNNCLFTASDGKYNVSQPHYIRIIQTDDNGTYLNVHSEYVPNNDYRFTCPGNKSYQVNNKNFYVDLRSYTDTASQCHVKLFTIDNSNTYDASSIIDLPAFPEYSRYGYYIANGDPLEMWVCGTTSLLRATDGTNYYTHIINSNLTLRTVSDVIGGAPINHVLLFGEDSVLISNNDTAYTMDSSLTVRTQTFPNLSSYRMIHNNNDVQASGVGKMTANNTEDSTIMCILKYE